MTRLPSPVILLIFSLVAVLGVWLRPLTPIDETRYIAVAWEMWLNGDYFVPTKNFEIYSHKPPLLFWLINLVWAVTGVMEFPARLVGPALGVATIALTGVLARRLWPEDATAGTRAMLILSGMSLFAVYAGLTMFDALLAACVVAAIIALMTAAQTGLLRWWISLGVCVGLGVLAKGPVVLLHVVPAGLAMSFWLRHASRPVAVSNKRLALGGAIALAAALAVVALWLGPALLTGGPDYREAILWRQTAGRVVSSFAHARPWWFFLALLPVLLFPWVWMPALWRSVWRDDGRDPGLRLGLVWGASALVLFSLISGKQAHYLVPELPAAALIIAHLLRGRAVVGIAPALLPVVVLGLGMLAIAIGAVPESATTRMLEPRLVLVPLALGLGAIGWLALRRGGLDGGALLGLGSVLIVNLVIGTTQVRPTYDTTPIASRIAPFQEAGIAYPGDYHAEFNFAGRLTQPVANPDSAQDMAEWQSAHPAGLVVARMDRGPERWPPHETILFRGRPYGLWHMSEAPENRDSHRDPQ
ncbi:MAG: glycosyltransferase [Rhodobacteraceae bacterium CG17_big_fil_post_rev_8_21_14_2_50_65_11]|nr:MAG: glycosyltransferase [Rhodobacteraceae bacterium CG17_big_fil_post_rev_8_21_14_2_50_65_11]